MVRLDVGVREQMGLQVRALVEAPVADRALVGRLLEVEDLVDGERARLAESLPALGALERLLLRVDVPAAERRSRTRTEREI